MDIKNQTAIITGAASGMGAATAKHLVSCGANVILLDRDESVLSLADEISGQGFVCDVLALLNDWQLLITIGNLK